MVVSLDTAYQDELVCLALFLGLIVSLLLQGQRPAAELRQPQQFFLMGYCDHTRKISDLSLRIAALSLLERIGKGKEGHCQGRKWPSQGGEGWHTPPALQFYWGAHREVFSESPQAYLSVD